MCHDGLIIQNILLTNKNKYIITSIHPLTGRGRWGEKVDPIYLFLFQDCHQYFSYYLLCPQSLGEGRECQNNILKPAIQIYKAFLKSITNAAKYFPRSLDKKKTTLYSRLAAAPIAALFSLERCRQKNRLKPQQREISKLEKSLKPFQDLL